MEGELGIIGEFEFEIEASRSEGIEEDRVGRSEGEIVDEDKDAAVGGAVDIERGAQEGEKRDERNESEELRHC